MNKNGYVTADKTFFVFKKHQPEDAKWRDDASKYGGRLFIVSQLKRDDLIKLKLDFSGKANVGKRRRTGLEHV
jgi:hypothetical protein